MQANTPPALRAIAGHSNTPDMWTQPIPTSSSNGPRMSLSSAAGREPTYTKLGKYLLCGSLSRAGSARRRVAVARRAVQQQRTHQSDDRRWKRSPLIAYGNWIRKPPVFHRHHNANRETVVAPPFHSPVPALLRQRARRQVCHASTLICGSPQQ